MGEFLWNSLVPHEAQDLEAEELTLDQDRDSGSNKNTQNQCGKSDFSGEEED